MYFVKPLRERLVGALLENILMGGKKQGDELRLVPLWEAIQSVDAPISP